MPRPTMAHGPFNCDPSTHHENPIRVVALPDCEIGTGNMTETVGTLTRKSNRGIFDEVSNQSKQQGKPETNRSARGVLIIHARAKGKDIRRCARSGVRVGDAA